MNYDLLFAQLQRHEGLRLLAYKCTKGFWTIGYGRNLETNPLSKSEMMAIFGKVILPSHVIPRLIVKSLTPDQAELLFINDVSNVEEDCHKNLPMHLHNDARKAVFINMAFQLGMGGLLGFSNTLKFAAAQNYERCAAEMLDSKWAREDTPYRAYELSEQMRTGEWA